MATTLTNPYAFKGGRWLRGNLHTHTTRSDGTREPQVVVDDYKARGYDFLMISDHDKITDVGELDDRGMVLLYGNEISARGPHLLHIDAKRWIEPQPDRQAVINQVVKAGGLAVLNHPNWEAHYNHCALEKLQAWKNYIGIEIFNGVCERLEGSAYALDKWDRLLNAGRPVWGFANDDSHRDEDVELGWNVVLARKPSAQAIFEALQAGRFYASTGVTIKSIEVHGPVLEVKTADAQRIAVFTNLGKQIARVEGKNLKFDASDLASSYIRVECYGAGGRTAWTQPFTIRGGRATEHAKMLLQRPVLNVHRVKSLPKPGEAAPAVWKKALSHSGFLDLQTARRAAVQTHVQALTDGKALLMRFDCEEPKPERIKATIWKNGDLAMWTDDSIEIFLDVKGTGREHWQVVVNANGFWSAANSKASPAVKGIRTQACRTAAGWRVEVLVPLAELRGEANLNRWRINIGRNQRTSGVTSTWKWVGGSFHAPQHFGRMKVH